MEKQTKTGDKPTITWDDSKMRSTYANVCNVSSTREEITLLFGLNQSWNAQQKELKIELSDRIILNPLAARRMADLLNNALKQHQESFNKSADTAGNAGSDAA